MTTGAAYFTATVVDNLDEDELGRLSLIIPGISGTKDPHPDWIPPRVTPGAGPASGWFYVPPVDAVVVVERDAAGVLRWTGGTWGAVNTIPELLAANYPRRSGFTSPEGATVLALDEDTGLLVMVPDAADPDGPANFMALDGDAGEAKIGLASGTLFMLTGTQVIAMTPAGASLVLDEDNGIVLTHQDGAEFLSLSSGVATLSGTDVQVVGGAVTVTGQGGITLSNDPTGVTPTEPVILGTSFLTDLATFLAGCVADAAMSPGVAAAAGTFMAEVATALGAGAPYLSGTTTTT